ncbi:MAG: NUDIX hydrolase [Betaproteobacteria bacterium]|nr:NUDIX hydrolase [Betaproteobacteria bacterium]
MNGLQVLRSLEAHHAMDAEEARHLEATHTFIKQRVSTWWRRSTQEGHVTASAWVLNAQYTSALLLHHAKLDRWLQPGGHIDGTDISPAHSALREAKEETGLNSLELAPMPLWDVDVHAIPANKNEPAHLHYDLRYLVISHDAAVTLSHESLGFRWVSLQDLISESTPSSLSRMARKARYLQHTGTVLVKLSV